MTLEELEETGDSGGDAAEAEEKPRLNLEIAVTSPSTCQRHVTVTIPRDDVQRYYDEAFSDLMDSAVVPGFRAGRAPRKLVEARFRKEVTEQVRNSLLMDSMAQVNEDEKLAAISEPDLDLTAVEVPDEGPMTFEFDLEVRPDFNLPDWKGLSIERPTREFSREDIDRQLRSLLERHGRLVPYAGTAEPGDYLTLSITSRSEGTTIIQKTEESVCLRSTLSFRDGVLEKFDQLLSGARAGDHRIGSLKLSDDAANESLRGKTVELEFEVLEVKKFELPELSHEFLARLGFESEGDLRDAIADRLQRQLQYRQQERAREQITRLLTESASWDLPPTLLKRQSERELHRSVLEYRRSGFSETEIRAHENQLRQNSRAETARALREHFILERIAEDEKIDLEAQDYDDEIELIARQNSDTPRRVRAQLEKRGLMDSLRNQIVERKVISRVLEHARFKDVPFVPGRGDIEAIDLAVGGGGDAEIPAAEHGEEAGRLPELKDRR